MRGFCVKLEKNEGIKMATVLYKDGEPVRVEAPRVSNHLENGYFLSCDESLGIEAKAPTKKPKAAKKKPIAKKKPTAKKTQAKK